MLSMRLLPRLALAAGGCFVPALAQAGEINGADSAWILTATALVLFMTIPGLSLFYGGLVRSKNVLSVLMQCFAGLSLLSVLWFLCGFSLCFSATDLGLVGGLEHVGLAGIGYVRVMGGFDDRAAKHDAWRGKFASVARDAAMLLAVERTSCRPCAHAVEL